MATASLLRPSCGTLEACRRPSSAPATRVVLAIPSRQQPLSRQQRRQRAVVAQAGRGGGTGSGSDEEDYFGEQGSIDDGSEYYDSEDVEELADTSMRLYLDSADIKVCRVVGAAPWPASLLPACRPLHPAVTLSQTGCLSAAGVGEVGGDGALLW